MKSLSSSQPHVIIMVGIPGSGKSFFAEKFAETFHAPCISSRSIEELGNVSPSSANTLSVAMLKEFFKTKQSIILDIPTDTPAERIAITRLAKKANYAVLFVWVQTDPATAKMRSTKGTKETPGVMSLEEFNQAVKRFSAPNAIEKPIVISGKHTFATQAKIILKRLSEPRSTHSNASDITPKRSAPPQGRRTVIVR